MVLIVILSLIVLVNSVFAVRLIRDMIKHKAEIMKEPGNNFVMAIYSFFLFLASTFGISDFAISMACYPKLKWVGAKKMPGTLNIQCTIPAAVMALAYINSIKIDLLTLIVPIICQMLGSYLSPRYVVKLPANTIKKVMSVGLFISAGFILAGKFGLMPSGGEATQLTGIKLVILGVCTFMWGALNNIGIGSYSTTMATAYALGLNPAAAFPIMMGSSAFSVPIGSMQFIKLDSYNRKITLFTSTLGVIGVLIAVFVVKSLDLAALQWVVVVVILYSAISMMLDALKEEKEIKEPVME